MLSTPLFFNLHPHHFARQNGNCIHDVSSFFLFEATGDSEADSSVDPGGSAAVPDSVEFNDAESCTADTPNVCDLLGDEDDEEEEEDEKFEENDEVVESSPAAGFTKSSASLDSTKEFQMLNEVDKNRLFWETCLAS